MSALSWSPICGVALAGALLLAGRPVAAVGHLVSTGRLDDPSPLRSRPTDRAGAPTARWVTAVVVAAAAVVIPFGGVSLAVATAVAGATLATGVVGRRRARTQDRILDARRRAVRHLVSELAAGARPAAALAGAAEVEPLVGAVLLAAATQAHSGGAAELLIGDHLWESVGRAWLVARDSGAPLAAVLARVAADLDADARVRRTVATVLAGPRSSAALLAGLPLLGLLLGTAMGSRPVPTLLGTPAGRALACAGVLLDAAGVWSTRWIARRCADA